jgi:hypothetical protein
VRGGLFSSASLGAAADLREARLGAPARGVLDPATLDAAADDGGRVLGVRVDFLRGVRFFTGDSPLTPRKSNMSTSAFPSDGTKMLDPFILIREVQTREMP